MVLVATLLAGNNRAFAQEKAVTVNWTGEVTPTNPYADGTIINITGDVILKQGVVVSEGATVTIRAKDADRKITFKRASGTGNTTMFYAPNASLVIDGNGHTLTIDGGTVYNTSTAYPDSGDGRNTVKSTQNCRVIRSDRNLTMKNVIIQNAYFDDEAVAIYLAYKDTAPTDTYTCNISHCTFKGLKGGSIIYYPQPIKRNVTFNHVTWTKNDAAASGSVGGMFRGNGGSKVSVTMSHCEASYSKSVQGLFHWNSNGMSTCKLTVMGNTKVHHNEVTEWGGAFALCGAKAEIKSAQIYNNSAGEGGGIGVRIHTANLETNNLDGQPFQVSLSDSVSIHDNTATIHGGGIWVEIRATSCIGFDATGATPVPIDPFLCKLDIEGAQIYNNKAPEGGGIYLEDFAPKTITRTIGGTSYTSNEFQREVNINSGEIYGNETTGSGSDDDRKGAGIYIRKHITTDSGVYPAGTSGDWGTLNVNITGGNIHHNKANYGSGGGIYVLDEVTLTSGYENATSVCNVNVFGSPEIYGNTCDYYGAGIYLRKGTFTMTGGTIGKDGTTKSETNHNVATNHGGGFYIKDGTCTIKGGTIAYNDAVVNGGGFYVDPGSSDSTVINSYSAATTISDNTAQNGAGAYVASGSLAIRNEHASRVTTIKGNVASVNGGAIFMNGGNCTIDGGLSAGLATNPTIGESGAPNKAVLGAGIYATGGTMKIKRGTITYNQATNTTGTPGTSGSGGGVYANGLVKFTNGSISNNSAIDDGGGVYISSTGELQISGTATMTGNNVKNGQGGGVYQGHTMTAAGSSLNISGNTKGTAKALSANNVYLPNNKTIKIGDDISTTGVTLGIYTQYKANDPAVTDGKIPVLTSNDNAAGKDKLDAIYRALQGGTSRITDDRMEHQPAYTLGETTLYFTLLTFDRPAYTKPYAGPISNVDSLYKYMCWVNGVNGYTSTHPGEEGDLQADISLSGINHWIPIGSNSAFIGEFNGNGHTISDLTIDGIGGYTNYGLFGQTAAGAEITDLFVKGLTLTKSAPDGGLGTIVGTMAGGTISGCVASGTLTTTATDCMTGGLVGKLTGGTIHSSSAMAEMTGYQMGGLAGSNAGNLYNSFANPKFTYSGSGTEYVGGLVAVNTGSIENCYVRLERAQSLGSAHFGMLAGSNTGTDNIVACYAPNGASDQFNHSYTYLYNSLTTGLQNCDLYNKTIAPYRYNRSTDNTLVTASSSNLLDELDRWVSGHSGYSSWTRTRAGGYITGQDINGDYPIHKYSDYHCVASVDGITLDYAATLDAMLTSHNTSGTTINLYTADAVDGSGNNAHTTTATGVVVYVDEDVCVLPEADKNVRANTCQTLRAYASSYWHDVSSSLQSSKIGFTYGSDGQSFSWDPNPCSVTLGSSDNESLFPTDLGNLARCDLYCFYEPEYHWLNLKRNTNSHWHMNATNVPIVYNGNGTGGNGNEDHLVPGKGYLVSVDKDQLLENEGILNRGNVTLQNVTKTDFNAWAERLGFNLLGNPYQSYLDFEAFMNTDLGSGVTNADNLWDSGSELSEYNRTFAIFDPSLNSYVQYKNGTSYGSYGATQYIHPHQGFFIRMTKGSGNTNTTTVTYTNAMRKVGDYGAFRDEEQPAYPLVNFLVHDSDGNGDVAVLELGRSNNEGALKMRLGDCTGRISLGYDGHEYGILFRTEVEEYQPLHFDATKAGTFTLEWNTANVEFEKLTLIDNIAGTTTDMLSHDSYTFEADPDQYTSRFKVVIGDYKDVDEFEEDGPSTGSGSFAYYTDGEIRLAETQDFASLQIIDMLGRVIARRDAARHISTNGIAPGVYMLRLTNANGTRTQKIVIR